MSKKFNSFHHIDQKTVDQMFEGYSPVFVLSTGRSGSKFIHHILSQAESIVSYHEASPTLMYFSNYAYHSQYLSEQLQAMFQAARMELLLDAYNNSRTYVESNHCLTFFAPSIVTLYPNTRFVHLIRHPGDFIRSAMMKGWHSNDSIWESGRVRLKDNELWNRLSQPEKLAWVWRLTNEFVLTFSRNSGVDKFLTVKFEDITNEVSVLKHFFSFVDASLSFEKEKLEEMLKTPINKHRIGLNEPSNIKKLKYYPSHEEWPAEVRHLVKNITGDISSIFGYIF